MTDFPSKTGYTHLETPQKKDLLTKRTAELVDVIGYDAAMLFVENFKGEVIWVPKNAKPDHPLSLIIGFDAFKKLTWYYGDTSLEVDICKALDIENRNRNIFEDRHRKGLTCRDLARKYQTTERHVRRILRKYSDSVKTPTT